MSSGIQSPTPPPGDEREEGVDLRRSSSSIGTKVSTYSQSIHSDSNIPYVPAESDNSLRAVDWRARRGSRIATDIRETFGHPTIKLSDGSVKKATGLWGLLEQMDEQIRTMTARIKMLEDVRATQVQSRADLSGFIKTRAERALDKLLMLLVVLAFGYFTRRSWMPPEPQPPSSIQTSEGKPAR